MATLFGLGTSEVREIPLSKGLVALVDAADFDWLNQWRWHAACLKPYAARREYLGGGRAAQRSRTIYMHQMLLPSHGNLVADHRNRDGLDNRRQNLRLATASQNNVNAARKVGVSGYIGVHPFGRRWKAAMSVGNKQIQIGVFDTPEEAAAARDVAALNQWGEFASLNAVRP